jgi:phosphoglycolate phosphatase-like HAD superfamily hydrolase
MPNGWAIFDLDGTLANCSERLHLAQAKKWDAFHSRCFADLVYPAEAQICRAWVAAGGHVIYSTGRSEPFRQMTRDWLRINELPDAPLYMRAVGDHRPSTVTKVEQLDRILFYIAQSQGTIAFIMEDQDKLVALWRSLGYTCLQPRPGAF